MKKYIAGLVLTLALVVPSFSYAQTVPPTAEELNAQYQSLVIQLIDLLTKQIVALQAQLALQQAQTPPATGVTSTPPVATVAPFNLDVTVTPTGKESEETYPDGVVRKQVVVKASEPYDLGLMQIVNDKGITVVPAGSLDFTSYLYQGAYTWTAQAWKGGGYKYGSSAFPWEGGQKVERSGSFVVE